MEGRKGNWYQLARRATLTASVLWMVGVPAWHLAHNQHEAAGLYAVGAEAGWLDDLGLASEPAAMGAPWTVELYGVELMDPVASLSLLTTGAHVVVVALLPTLIIVGLLGRFFCGWLCPYVPVLAASNAARALLRRLGWRPRDAKLNSRAPFLVLGTMLVISALAGTHLIPLLYPPAIIGRELFRFVFYGAVGSGLAVIALAFLFDTLVSRAGFCRYLCPGGAVFRLLGAASPVVVRRTASACTDCGDCVVVCNLGQSPMTDRLDTGCERCGKCVASCPTDALKMDVKVRLPLVQISSKKT